jgi:hypothetical protein
MMIANDRGTPRRTNSGHARSAYPVVPNTVTIGKQAVPIFDVLGKDVPLFHYTTGDEDDDTGSQFVQQARGWFDSVWTTIAHEYTP